MKIQEIREMTQEEIIKRIAEDEDTLINLRFQNALKQLTNTANIRNIKKDIAKMKTVLTIREKEALKAKESNK